MIGYGLQKIEPQMDTDGRRWTQMGKDCNEVDSNLSKSIFQTRVFQLMKFSPHPLYLRSSVSICG